jgi:hypothetical protein
MVRKRFIEEPHGSLIELDSMLVAWTVDHIADESELDLTLVVGQAVSRFVPPATAGIHGGHGSRRSPGRRRSSRGSTEKYVADLGSLSGRG